MTLLHFGYVTLSGAKSLNALSDRPFGRKVRSLRETRVS